MTFAWFIRRSPNRTKLRWSLVIYDAILEDTRPAVKSASTGFPQSSKALRFSVLFHQRQEDRLKA
jgi:hypothetical protein